MSRVFISYRRDDSLGHVGWLRSLLIQRFGADQIFRDIETIPPGVDFVEAIEAAVGSCEVLLAVIGPRWLTTTERPGQRRLDNPEDFVRIEIATALERNIRVIPVLVQDAHMPHSNELPADIAKLARRNAIELRDSSWEYDVGRLGDALETILQSQAPTNPIDALMAQFAQAEKQEDWDTAIAVGEQILKIDPSSQSTRYKTADAYRSRGNARQARGDLNEAITDYEQSIRLDPNYPATYNWCGVARKAGGDLNGAVADFRQAIKLDPNYAAAYNNRGFARYKQGDLKGAIADYDQTIKLDPKYAVAFYNRGLTRFYQNDIKGAMADYDQAIKLNPNYAAVYYNRGLVYLTKKNSSAARRDFERAAELGHEGAKKELSRMNRL